MRDKWRSVIGYSYQFSSPQRCSRYQAENKDPRINQPCIGDHRYGSQERSIIFESKITYRGIVYPWHCDHMGHMNVMWYTSKFDEACWNLLAMLGLHRSGFAQDGAAMAAIEQHIQYKRELFAGDTVTIESALLEVNDKSLRLLHKMVHEASGEVAAMTMIVAAHLDRKVRKAIRLPECLRQKGASDERTCHRGVGGTLGVESFHQNCECLRKE